MSVNCSFNQSKSLIRFSATLLPLCLVPNCFPNFAPRIAHSPKGWFFPTVHQTSNLSAVLDSTFFLLSLNLITSAASLVHSLKALFQALNGSVLNAVTLLLLALL